VEEELSTSKTLMLKLQRDVAGCEDFLQHEVLILHTFLSVFSSNNFRRDFTGEEI